MAANKAYAIVAGVGSGTGRAVALKFAKSYQVVLLSRSASSYSDIVAEVNKAGGNAIGFAADVTDLASLKSVFADIKKEVGDKHLAAAVYNVGGGFVRKPFLELTPEEFTAGWESNGRGLYNFSTLTLPQLLGSVSSAKYPPSLLITGATASVRGSANCASFAQGKFAMRAIAQSLAREFGPRGVHVSHIVVDGVIDIPRTHGWQVNGGVEDGKLAPAEIAETYWNLHTQHRSTFTFELDIRPFVEKW